MKCFTDYSNINVGEDTELSNQEHSSTGASAVKLNDNTVFIAHGINNYLYGMLCTISATDITVVTDIQLSTVSYSGWTISAVALSENKVFIAHSCDDFLDGCLGAIVCTINGTEITAGSDTKLSTTSYTGGKMSAIALSENKVFIAHSYNSNNYLYAIVCNISGTTITKGTDTQLSSSVDSGYEISAIALSESKVFIAHRSNTTNCYLYAIVCTISDKTITKGTDTLLSAVTSTAHTISAVALEENRVFIAHNYGNKTSDYFLYGIVCTISGATITKGTDTQISSVVGSGWTIRVTKLTESKIFIVHSSSNSHYLHSTICTINEMTITDITQKQLSTVANTAQGISALVLTKDKLFIVHGSSNYILHAIINTFIKCVCLLSTSTDDIYGISKDNGAEGDTVDVYRPYEEVAV